VSKLKAIIDSGIRSGVDKSQPPRQMPDEASLMFLHNTSAEKLQRVQDMGGMPMPSIAITDKDIPFENFGDITLVGKPESFDPKSSSLNQAFSADAYTVRAPRPVRIAKKGAGKRFQELYGADAKELDVYAADTAANVWDLETKGDVREDKYDQVVHWFVSRAGPIFLKRKGVPFNRENGPEIAEKLQPFYESGEFRQWAAESADDLFEEGEYFIANPNRDYYTQKAKLTPYTADEIAKFMKRSAGRGGEGGMSTGSPGSVRAAYTDKLTSLDAMRKRKDQLSGDIGIKKEEIENLLIDLGDALKPYYKYDPNGWSYRDAVSELMTEGATRGLKRSADFVGFENIPKDLMSELEGFQQILKKAPTEYFESKPKRVVQLNEFAGAIVPEGTKQSTIDLLTRQGLEIERYTDDAQRLEARRKFKNLLFQLSPVAVTTVLAGIAAGAPGRAEAGPIKKVHKAVNPFHNMQPEVRFNLYSKAEQVALGMRQAKQLGADAKRHFEKQGVTKEEMEALGLTDLFKQKRVTQQEIMEAIEDNRLVLEEKQSSEHGYVGDPDVGFKTETLSAEDAYGPAYLSEEARDLIDFGGMDRSEFIPIFDKWAETSPYGMGDGAEASLARAAADFSKFVDGELELEDLNGAIQNEILEAAEETARFSYDDDPLEIISFTPQGSNTTYRLVGNEWMGYGPHGQDYVQRQNAPSRAMMDDYVPAQGIYSRDEAEVILRAAARDRGDLSAGDGGTQWSEFTIPGGKNYTEYRFQLDPDNEEFFRESTHFDDDVNNIFHIRTTDRDGPEGEKVLFVEEIQSDWAQSGRNYGFKDQSLIDQNQALLLEQLPQDIKSMIVDEQKLRDSGSILAGDIAEALDLAGATDRELFPEINRQTRSLRKLMGAKRALEELRTQSRIAKRFVKELAKTMTDDDKIRWVERNIPRLLPDDASPEQRLDQEANVLSNFDKLIENRAMSELRYADEMGLLFGSDNKVGKLLNKVEKDIAKEDSQKLLDAGLPENFESLLDAAIEKNRPMLNAIEGETGKPQAAPFVTKTDGWNKLAVKRIMNKAAKEGYDMVAFSSGDIQFKRWNNEGLKKEYDVVLPGLIKTVAGKKPDLKIQVGEGSESYQVPAIRLDDKVGKQTVREKSLSPQTMFSTGAGITALGAASLLAPDQAEAGGLGSLPAATKKARAESVKQAKEQGYDLKNVMYHASKQDIKEFVPGYSDGLVFLTPSKEFANNWLGKGKFQERQDGTGAVEGVRAEKKRWREEADKILKSLPEDQRQQYYEEILNPQQQQLLKDERLADSAIYPVVTRTKKPFVPSKNVDVLEELYSKEYLDAPFGSGFPTYRDALKDGNYLLYEKKEVVDFLKSKGYDSMFLKESSGADKPFTTLAVFEPNNIRSVNAKFDPEKKDSPQILASAPFAAGAAGLGAAAMLSPEQAQAQTLNASGFNLQYPIKPKKESPGVASLAGQLGLGAMSEIGGAILGGAAGVGEYLRGSRSPIPATAQSIRDANEGVSDFVGGLYDAGPEAQVVGQEIMQGIGETIAPIAEYAMEGPIMDERGLNMLPLIAQKLGIPAYQLAEMLFNKLPEREQEAAISASDAFL
jgi:hypothetical protein